MGSGAKKEERVSYQPLFLCLVISLNVTKLRVSPRCLLPALRYTARHTTEPPPEQPHVKM
jgi:hypothetical protein